MWESQLSVLHLAHTTISSFLPLPFSSFSTKKCVFTNVFSLKLKTSLYYFPFTITADISPALMGFS